MNNLWEVVQPILFAPLARLIALGYIAYWDSLCLQEAKKGKRAIIDSTSSGNSESSSTVRPSNSAADSGSSKSGGTTRSRGKKTQ